MVVGVGVGVLEGHPYRIRIGVQVSVRGERVPSVCELGGAVQPRWLAPVVCDRHIVQHVWQVHVISCSQELLEHHAKRTPHANPMSPPQSSFPFVQNAAASDAQHSSCPRWLALGLGDHWYV